MTIYCIHDQGLLIIKRGGHNDQLSKSLPGIDRFRIKALQKILKNGILTESQSRATLKTLEEKCRIYGTGCLKRGRIKEGQHYLTLSEQIQHHL